MNEESERMDAPLRDRRRDGRTDGWGVQVFLFGVGASVPSRCLCSVYVCLPSAARASPSLCFERSATGGIVVT